MKIFFVTSNKNKAKEMRELAKPWGIEIEQIDCPYLEIQSDRLEQIASNSARRVASLLKKTIIVEDSGLFIDTLRGFPGPYSSYVLHTIGNEGVLKIAKNRNATFKSVIAFCEPNKEPKLFIGEIKGRIAARTRGERGFGFDPIFVPNSKTRTFAEMSTAEKNKLSHRARAFTNLAKSFYPE